MNVIDTKMDIKIKKNDINITHRIGKPKNNGKPRPVLSNLFETFGFQNVWTVNRTIFYSENGSQHPKIYYY